MELETLLQGINYVTSKNIDNIKINNITHDSRQVGQGDCFVALRGVKSDGMDYVAQAVMNGAHAIVTDSFCNFEIDNTPIIFVENARSALSVMACNFYGNPSKQLKMIGVVGTNGKTSCVKIMQSILTKLDKKVASIGTLGAEFCGKKYSTGMTTPDPMQLQALLRDMARDMVEYVVMEVSAHAIHLRKTSGIIFDCLLFTNITQDHMDYFVTMEQYSAVKLGFFNQDHTLKAIVNIDDVYANKLLHDTNVDTRTYGINNKCDYFANDIKYQKGLSFNLYTQGNNYIINSKLIGKFNVYNLLGAIGVLKEMGVSMDKVINAIKTVECIEGRCNLVTSDNIKYIIDYAHTPDGIKNILITARDMALKNVIIVFGCGGERDKLKRPIMGSIASSLADKVIVTSDNPRSEEPHAIIEEILSGITDLEGSVIVCPDRKHAIKQAVYMAQKGDVVVIAGKGAEEFMEVNGEKLPYSDIETLKEFLGENCD